MRDIGTYTTRTGDKVIAVTVADWDKKEQEKETSKWGSSEREPIAVFNIGPAQNEEEARRRATALIGYIKREQATVAALAALEF